MYTLLIKENPDPRFQEFLDKVLKGHNCEICEEKEFCPLPSIQIVKQDWIVVKDDDLNEIKKIIKKEFENATIIIVMDDAGEICYIFKAEGELAEFKKKPLKEVFAMYERVEKNKRVFSEIRDVRNEPIVIKEEEKAPEEKKPESEVKA